MHGTTVAMASPKDPRPERSCTDSGLARERGRTDEELEKRAQRDENLADSVLATARRRADEVVTLARERADENLGRSEGERAALQTFAHERQEEDELLRNERATADEVAAADRVARRKAVNALLASERAATDESLGRERELADAALASRDEFMAMASHDLRNMIGVIAVSTSSLVDIPCDGSTHKAIVRDAERIQRSAGRMARLVGDLIDVASIEAGRLAVAPERHDALELLRETMEVFQPLAAAKQIWIGTDVKPGSLLARYDRDRILQVLANLVGNALKFTPKEGRIHVLVEPADGYVRFAVSDTGRGIAPDKLSVIFDRYWQLVDRTARSGLGLGLYISKCIVEAHGGRIWAESRPGEGSTFFFTLPGANGTSAPRPATRPE